MVFFGHPWERPVSLHAKPVPAFDLVSVGATGDLDLRKLVPALFQRHADGQIPDDSRIVGVARGNAALFMRRDEVMAAWRWIDPILAAWTDSGEAPRPYTAGIWGPSAAIALIERDGRTWNEEGQ